MLHNFPGCILQKKVQKFWKLDDREIGFFKPCRELRNPLLIPCSRWPEQEVLLFDLFWVVVSNMFYFHPYLRKWAKLTNMFKWVWNYQLVLHVYNSVECKYFSQFSCEMAAHVHEKCEMRKRRISAEPNPGSAFFTIAAVNGKMLGAIKLRELSSATRLEESQNKEILFFQDHDAWFNMIKFAETERCEIGYTHTL